MAIKSVKYMERKAGEMYEFLELTFDIECDTVPLDQELALCKEYADAAFKEYKKTKPFSQHNTPMTATQPRPQVSYSAPKAQAPQAPQGQRVTQEVNTGVPVPPRYWDIKKGGDWKGALDFLGTLVPQYIGNYKAVKGSDNKYYIHVVPRTPKPTASPTAAVYAPQPDFSGMPDVQLGYEDDDMPFS